MYFCLTNTLRSSCSKKRNMQLTAGVRRRFEWFLLPHVSIVLRLLQNRGRQRCNHAHATRNEATASGDSRYSPDIEIGYKPDSCARLRGRSWQGLTQPCSLKRGIKAFGLKPFTIAGPGKLSPEQYKPITSTKICMLMPVSARDQRHGESICRTSSQ